MIDELRKLRPDFWGPSLEEREQIVRRNRIQHELDLLRARMKALHDDLAEEIARLEKLHAQLDNEGVT